MEGENRRVGLWRAAELESSLGVQGCLQLDQVIRHVQRKQSAIQLLAELADRRGDKHGGRAILNDFLYLVLSALRVHDGDLVDEVMFLVESADRARRWIVLAGRQR